MKSPVKNNDVGCLVLYTCRGAEYLCGFESFLCGESFLPYFSLNASCAFPLSRSQSDFVLSKLDYNLRVKLNFILYPRCEDAPSIYDLEHSPAGGVL